MMGLGTMSGLLLALLVLFSYIYSFSGQVSETTPAPLTECPSGNNKPCRIQFTTIGLRRNSTTTERETCTCSNGRQCNSNWNTLSNHVLFLRLAVQEDTMDWKMKFCGRIKPHNKRLCESNETALRLTGANVVATDVEFYKCRCNQIGHLHHKTTFFYHGVNYFDYVCHDLPTCMRYMNCSVNIGSYQHPECHCEPPMACEPLNRTNLFYNPRCV